MMQIRLNKQWGIPAITGAACFIAGTGVGYMVASARLSKKVKEIEENQRMLREHFEGITRDRTEPTIAEPDKDVDMVQHVEVDVVEIVETSAIQVEDRVSQYPEEELETIVVEFEEPVPFHSRIFTEDPDFDTWDYDVEVPTRGNHDPYVIHRDEFFAEESGFRQTSLSYYAGDNILCDEKDQPIYNHELIVGEHNLKFGHGSKDRSIVYIRNPHLQAEYEIILDNGYYQVEVLGTVIEEEMGNDDLKHSVYRYRKD
jgi:hypothetical protein